MATYCVHSFFTGCVSEKGITQWSKIFVKVTSQQASHSKPKSSEIYYIIFIRICTVIRKMILVVREVLSIFCAIFSFFRMKYMFKRKISWENLYFESDWIRSLCQHSCFNRRWLVRFDDVKKCRPMREDYQMWSNRNLSFYLQKTCRHVIAKRIQSKCTLFSFQIKNR